jgi:WD40 repeat protein
VALTPDGRRAMSGSRQKTLRVWDLETGRCLRTLKGHKDWVWSVAFTPDGRRTVSRTGDKALRVWDLETGQCLRSLEGHTDVVSSVALTPDGRRAVFGSGDKTLRVRDLETGRCLRTLEGHTDRILSVALTPDGRRAVSASGDKTLRVWDLESGQWLTVYQASADVYALTINVRGLIVCGTKAHEVLFINCRGLDMQPPAITPVMMWLYVKDRQYLRNWLSKSSRTTGRWDDGITATCFWCGRRFPVADGILDVIRFINRNAGLTPDQSPCLELPGDAWDEPGLLSECPLCHKPLKFNPFIVDNRGRY